MKTILTMVLFILVLSCKSEHKKSTETTIETETISTTDTKQLHLNTGKKWIANIETENGMKKIDSILKKHNTIEENNNLDIANALSQQTSYIIKSCDMKGIAHDQLHVVLLPILEEVSNLKEAQTVIDQNKNLKELRNLTAAYFKHFTSN